MQLLSEDAILHISAGFEGPFILQAFSIQHDLYKRGIFNFCVTDGAVYIGARYEFQEDLELDNYNLVQITAKFVDRFHPIIIRTLDIISTSLKKLVGNPPTTLQDYFNREARSSEGEGALKKRTKPNEEISPMPIRKDIAFKKPANTPKREPSNSQKQQLKNQSEKKSEVINLEGSDKRLLKLDSSSQEQINNSRIDAIFNLDESDQNEKGTPMVVDSDGKTLKEMERTCFIKDLYERSTGWAIFCRVNYISIVQCQNGLFAANFILSDEEGDQIRCVYFACAIEEARETLRVGQCYLFSSGEIKHSHKQRELHITFDRNSYIIPQRIDRFRCSSRKFIRIDKLLEEKHANIASVVGVIRKINSRQHLRTKRKYTATLCDPLRLIQTDFMLFLNNEEKEIKVGMVIVLHNFQVYSQGNIIRLNSTYKSYYYEESGREVNEVISQICQIVNESDNWKNIKYKNISLFTFNHRTIHDFREIYRGTTDDNKLYTELDVWIFDVTLKTSYYACRNCKRSTEVKQMNLYQCLNCKRMVDTILTHTLCGTFADFTGSCSIDVIGEHAQNLLGMKSPEFHALSPDEQNIHLQSLKYKNMVIRLKSQKRGEKRENHSVWGIQKANPDMTIRQIKKQMQIYRLKKEQQQW